MKKIFLGIDHPAIAADDVEKLAKWYCDVLGYEVHTRIDKPVYLVKAPDGTLMEIMPKDDTQRPTRTTWTPGWSHLALRVNNITEAIKALDRHGVEWEGAEFDAVGGGRVRNLFDPEGNLLQIVERN
ncbi:MAG: VOC family protein [Tannerella sp.]|jgi:glyoxylase I family protein|nr:VOC family protein [Tannerella sp.]